MAVDDAIDQAARDRPDLILATAAGRPKAWGALAAHGVLSFRAVAGRPPTAAERRALWAGLWARAHQRGGGAATPAARYALMWSGGKDGALALLRARAQGLAVTRLVNFYDGESGRVRFHATRAPLIAAQARAIGIELRQYATSWPEYEPTFRAMLGELRSAGFIGVVFGDIHLAEVRAWYEKRLRAAGLAHLEPIWGEPPADLLAEFVASGSRAVVTCCEDGKLDERWLGRIIDRDFVQEIRTLPIDAAGENGEYHSFAFAGPLFREPVAWRPGARRRDGRFTQLDLEPSAAPDAPSGASYTGSAAGLEER